MKTGRWLLLLAAVLLICAGCETTPNPAFNTHWDAEPEYLPQSVIVKGNVRHPVLPWTERLTVSRAIVDADYIGQRDPLTISIQRNGERLFVDPARLVLGIIDPWLEPGDILELHTTTQVKRPYDLGYHDTKRIKALSVEP